MKSIKSELVVVGGGPGGYAAAFHAAEKGKKVLLVERDSYLGGVCLNRGCIPSKALLHATELISEAKLSADRGIVFSSPSIDLDKMRSWKESVVDKLRQGVKGLAKSRGVEVLHGRGYFESSNTLRVETEEGQQLVEFEKGIIAVGSKSAMPKVFDLGNPRIMTSREALDIEEIPERLLVIGGGYIGMELGVVYAKLGSEVTLVEALDRCLSTADQDLVKPVMQVAQKLFKEIRLKTKVKEMSTAGEKIKVMMDAPGENGEGTESKEELYDRVLVAVGRTPNCDDLGLENTGVQRDERGFIVVDDRKRTNDPVLYAIGDVAGGDLLAHKATREGRIAVEVMMGEESTSRDIVIPAVIFTDPEVAWCGLTEAEAKKRKRNVDITIFPWSASGRALSVDRPDGLTKMIVDPETERILGVGITGHGAAELIAEGALAIEMGATVRDLSEVVHPHPTLSETLMECAEVFFGQATHSRGKKRKSAGVSTR